MRWGREHHRSQNTESTASSAGAVLILGTILCLIFFLRATTPPTETDIPSLSPADAQGAVFALARQAPTLCRLLGLEEAGAVAVVSFGDGPEEQYEAFQREQKSFGDYLRKALGNLLGTTEAAP